MVDRFCTYYRVSTDKWGITGLGMDAQREAVSRYVQSRGQIIAEFIKVGGGKKHTNRPNCSPQSRNAEGAAPSF